jgi:hypothetical protein
VGAKPALALRGKHQNPIIAWHGPLRGVPSPPQKIRAKKNVHADGCFAVNVDVGVLLERSSWIAPCQSE